MSTAATGALAPHVADGALDRICTHLEHLAEIDGAPGHEQDVAAYITNSLAGLAEVEVRVDLHGNVIANTLTGTAGPVLLIAAHMDEVAFVVTGIDARGFLWLGQLGSAVTAVAPGSPLRVAGHTGVVGAPAGHFAQQQPSTVRSDYLYADIGAENANEVRAAGIDIGTPVVLQAPVQYFGLGRRFVTGKAIDNRLGCALLLTLLERSRPAGGVLTTAFTVQEEVGLKGAGAVAKSVKPDLALALDTIACGDTPDLDVEREAPVTLGAGPVLPLATGHRGNGHIVSGDVSAFLREIAAEAQVHLQPMVFTAGDNDASSMAWTGPGSRAASITVPRRYSHTAAEMADLQDVRDAFRMLQALVARMADWPRFLTREACA